jgi:hypothetical protein
MIVVVSDKFCFERLSIVNTIHTHTLQERKNKGACHNTVVALPFTLKKVSYGKRRIMETQMFHHAKNVICKKSFKRNPKSFKRL